MSDTTVGCGATVQRVNVLVIGAAKTGTTVISKTIQHSSPGADYHVEPKELKFFENEDRAALTNPQVVKIIFEHWVDRPRMRNALIHNEAKLKFDHVVCIVRDLRDEMLSRMLYLSYGEAESHGFDHARMANWRSLLETKETAPAEVSFVSLLDGYRRIWGRGPSVEDLIKFARPYRSFLDRHAEAITLVRYEDFMLSLIHI